MIEIAICDDSEKDVKHIMNLLYELFPEQKNDWHMRTFLSADKLLNETGKIDIAILDIVIGKNNGIETGRKLKERFPSIQLIYTTSYEQYVMQAINDVHAYSYLCKPIDKEKLRVQFAELLKSMTGEIIEKEFYNVRDSRHKEYAVVKLNLNEIIYFEYIKRQRRIAIVLENEIYEYDCGFEKLVNELESYGFVVNRRGSLVNLSHIIKIKGYTVFMDNGAELAISQRRIVDFRKRLNEFLHKNM